MGSEWDEWHYGDVHRLSPAIRKQYDMTFDHARRLYGPTDEPVVVDDAKAMLRSTARIKSFALAGNAHLTIRSTQTGTRYTYRVAAPRSKGARPIWFVSAMTGPDNESSYSYFANIRDDLTLDYNERKARVAKDAESVVAFTWAWTRVIRPERDDLLVKMQVWHEGRCGRCGRRLTVPESIETGIGPECIKRME